MRILLIADEESKYLWDYYQPGRLKDIDLIRSCGARKQEYLDNLETLRKNGRLSNLKALAANLLKIKPICIGTDEGTIEQLDQARGSTKALQMKRSEPETT